MRQVFHESEIVSDTHQIVAASVKDTPASGPIGEIHVEQGSSVLWMTHAQARALAEAILAQLAAEGK